MDDPEITFTFGSEGDFTLDSLLRDMSRLKDSLREADEALAKGRVVRYKVKKLSYNPHGSGTIEAKVVEPGEGERRTAPANAGAALLVRSLRGIIEQIDSPTRLDYSLPEGFDVPALLRLREKTANFSDWIEVDAGIETGSARIDSKMSPAIDQLLGPDIASIGAVVGRIERINVHGDANTFWIYPSVGPTKVECTFGKSLRGDAVEAVDRLARITGKLRFKRLSLHPYRIHVDHIELLQATDIPIGRYRPTPDSRGEEEVRRMRLAW